MKRLEICWNACKGITNEALERGVCDTLKEVNYTDYSIQINECKTYFGVRVFEDENI